MLRHHSKVVGEIISRIIAAFFTTGVLSNLTYLLLNRIGNQRPLYDVFGENKAVIYFVLMLDKAIGCDCDRYLLIALVMHVLEKHLIVEYDLIQSVVLNKFVHFLSAEIFLLVKIHPLFAFVFQVLMTN